MQFATSHISLATPHFKWFRFSLRHLFSLDDWEWTIQVIIYIRLKIIQLHLIHEFNINYLFHHQGSSHGIPRSRHIRHGCERWSASANFTMDRTGYRHVDLAFGTGTRQCNNRRDESNHHFDYSDFKPVYYIYIFPCVIVIFPCVK
jgi:hypothetical protein